MSDEDLPPGAAPPESNQDPEASEPAAAKPAENDGAPDEKPADQAPADFDVDDRAEINRDDVNREVGGMLGGTAAGNIRNLGQTAVGAGAVAAESILFSSTFQVSKDAKGWNGVFPREQIDRLRAGYARSPSDADLAVCLKERSVVYLSAPPGWGRHAAARVALAERHASDRVAMISIAPGRRIIDAVAEAKHFREDHGHIIDATVAQSIEFADLMAVDQQVGERHGTAVVIGPLAEKGHDLGSYLFPHRRPMPVEVFRSQLTHLLSGRKRDAEIDTWVAHPIVRRHLNEAQSLEEAARIAEVISGAPADEAEAILLDDLDRWLRTQARVLLRASDGEVRGDRQPWSGSPEYRRAFRLTFAALDGSSLAAVYDATDLLLRIQHNDPPDAEPGPQLELEFDGLLSYGMRLPTWPVPQPGEPRLARLANPELVRAMLDVAWNERALGACLLRWFDNLARDPQRAVRRRAALLAGLLCFSDFRNVMGGLVEKWARSNRRNLREAAGLSLLSCAHHLELRGRLVREVERWVNDEQSSTSYTRDSVAWAYAYGLGAQLPYDGLRRLRRIARDAWQRRSLLVAIGVDGSYTAERAGPMLDELRAWLTDDEPYLPTHAARAFVRLARRRQADRPDLLGLCDQGLVGESQLADQWSAALGLPATAASAWAALTSWLDCAEKAPDLAEPFLQLIWAIARDQALQRRLAHQCRHIWREQRTPSSVLDAVTAIAEGL
jgi:hypothetical protein